MALFEGSADDNRKRIILTKYKNEVDGRWNSRPNERQESAKMNRRRMWGETKSWEKSRFLFFYFYFLKLQSTHIADIRKNIKQIKTINFLFRKMHSIFISWLWWKKGSSQNIGVRSSENSSMWNVKRNTFCILDK